LWTNVVDAVTIVVTKWWQTQKKPWHCSSNWLKMVAQNFCDYSSWHGFGGLFNHRCAYDHKCSCMCL